MQWLRLHPYVSALCAAGILILFGIIVVERQAAAPTQSQATAWGGEAVPLLNPTSYAGVQNSSPASTGENIMDRVKGSAPYTYIPPTTTPPDTNTTPDPNNSFDFDSFVAMLSRSSTNAATTPKKSTGGTTVPIDAYAFIPTGLMTATTSQQSRSDTEQALYDYGNEIGSYIQSFEEQNSGEAQILKDQAEDRTDPDKAARLIALAQALQDVGHSLSQLDTVPTTMTAAHDALAQSYVDVGTQLALIAKTTNDADFLKAINTYNATADTFTKNYIRMASLFGAHRVSFASSDAGSVFTFNPTAGF